MNESNDGQSLSSADYNNSDTFLTGSHENNEPSLMERTAAHDYLFPTPALACTFIAGCVYIIPYVIVASFQSRRFHSHSSFMTAVC